MARQESCPRPTVQPAPLMEQIVSSLSIPGDRPVRPLARGPGPGALEVGQHQYLGSLCSCSDSLLRCSGSGRCTTAPSPQSIKAATETPLSPPPSTGRLPAHAAVEGRNYPRQTQRGGTQLDRGGSFRSFNSAHFKIYQLLTAWPP